MGRVCVTNGLVEKVRKFEKKRKRQHGRLRYRWRKW
jgi:hypothetical protein